MYKKRTRKEPEINQKGTRKEPERNQKTVTVLSGIYNLYNQMLVFNQNAEVVRSFQVWIQSPVKYDYLLSIYI